MCAPHWSNRDLFLFNTDCHIYQPAHILLCTLIIVNSAICFVYGLAETLKRKRKDLPISSMTLGLLFLLNYTIMVGENVTFIDRNILVNLLHSFARAMTWIVLGLNSWRHLEIVMSIDAHTVAKSVGLHTMLSKANYIIFGCSFVAELIGILIPTFNTNKDFVDFIAPTAAVLVIINSIPRVIYAWELRRIIIDIKSPQNEDFYNPLQKQLEGVISSTISGASIGEVFIFLWLFLPVFRHNMYVAYDIQMATAPVTGIVSLVTTARMHSEHHQRSGRDLIGGVEGAAEKTNTKDGSKGSKGSKGSNGSKGEHQGNKGSGKYPPSIRGARSPSEHNLTASGSQDDLHPLVILRSEDPSQHGGSSSQHDGSVVSTPQTPIRTMATPRLHSNRLTPSSPSQSHSEIQTPLEAEPLPIWRPSEEKQSSPLSTVEDERGVPGLELGVSGGGAIEDDSRGRGEEIEKGGQEMLLMSEEEDQMNVL